MSTIKVEVPAPSDAFDGDVLAGGQIAAYGRDAKWEAPFEVQELLGFQE